MKAKIVLIPFPFTDLQSTKLRPALVMLETKYDVVVAFVSSRLPQKPEKTEITIHETHPEFRLSGLKTSSVIRLDKIATISKELILGEIGEIGNQLKKEINKKLYNTYKL